MDLRLRQKQSSAVGGDRSRVSGSAPGVGRQEGRANVKSELEGFGKQYK